MPILVKEERTKDGEKGVWIIRRIWREDYPTTRQWEEIIEEQIETSPEPVPDKDDIIISLLAKIAGVEDEKELKTCIHSPVTKEKKYYDPQYSRPPL